MQSALRTLIRQMTEGFTLIVEDTEMRLSSFRTFTVGAVLAASMGIAGFAGVAAQETTPANGHPVQIMEGTCADLSPTSAVELMNLMPVGVEVDDNGDVKETPEVRGTLTAGDVTYSESDDIDFEWETMLGAPHAIVVYESEDNMESFIACGDIGGVVFDDDGDQMVVGLNAVGDSGYGGIGFLSNDEDGQADVEVYLGGPVKTTDDGSNVVATPEG